MTELNNIANIYQEILALLDRDPKNLDSCANIAYDLSQTIENSQAPHGVLNEYFAYLYDIKRPTTPEQHKYLTEQSGRLRATVEKFIKQYSYEYENGNHDDFDGHGGGAERAYSES